jgi:hypothetical protein
MNIDSVSCLIGTQAAVLYNCSVSPNSVRFFKTVSRLLKVPSML